ncbi:type II toxin-antitoxin system Phd/YefM family antitoxin [Streptomyces caniscabiei]|uniref:type II toxin-antitoxin system Phd/YefM family antitoxin n=1 Tax=Streptomyces caniscabiei TaxID=2746961 RepID=UPI001872999E|nr:type II toxin-antitoxin system Phd/YefM family antitoxin [Streptomyces caniscabiei]
MYNVTSTDARDVFAELIRRAVQGNETVGITRYGRVEAVLISNERYERLTRNLMQDD